MLNILIADDNYEFAKTLFNRIVERDISSIKIQKISSNGIETLEFIQNNQLDVAILDLQMPQLNGIEILENLNHSTNPKHIIVTSGDATLIKKISEKNLSITKIFTKPFQMDELIDYLQTLNKKQDSNALVKDQILELMSHFNFNKSSIGYDYIIDCISICVENKYLITPIEKNLYQKVAKKHHIEYNPSIKWAIEKTLSSMVKYTDNKILDFYFPHSKPTPKAFINEMFNVIMNKNK